MRIPVSRGIIATGGALCLVAPIVFATPPLPPAEACSALAAAGIRNTMIAIAQLNPASDTLPEHCEVIGAIDERVSPVDGQAYAIRFHLRMPTDWNNKFFYSGGGGTDGNLGNATGPQLQQGYAVVSTDSGHDNAINTSAVAGTFQFGFDPQARSDYGYNGPAQVTRKAKTLIKEFYGKAPKYSYFVGCSEGGREGLMFSQRYPDFFDGIVAGNPGMDLPKAGVAEAWDSQAFARAARAATPFGNPDLASSFTDAELAAIGNAILAKCDAKDGVVDGMVFNPFACDFDPATLGPSGTGALSQAQVTALKQVFGGAKNSHGRSLYAGWLWDPGIAAFGWRQWKIGPLFPGFPVPGNSAINVTLGGGALPFIFTTPPNSMTGGTDVAAGTTVFSANPLGAPGATNFGDAYVPWMLSFNMDTDAPKIFTRSGPYRESAMDFMGTSRTDYRKFRASGGKLIVYTGQADPVFSTRYHLNWYHELMEESGGLDRTQKFARVFLIPGMNHCGGGPATSQFDAFAAMVNWVEGGNAPDSIVATAPAGTPWPGRTRPLCAYPEQARYQGWGSIEDAANFRCALPWGDHRGFVSRDHDHERGWR
ncbi:MAG TPA: tannase/feruloyl esterase family alpha/beta hydrolase [Burkholderiales bacterium]